MDRFGQVNIGDELNGDRAHCLQNVMTLSNNLHTTFDNLHLWFQPTVSLIRLVFGVYLNSPTFEGHPPSLSGLLQISGLSRKVAGVRDLCHIHRPASAGSQVPRTSRGGRSGRSSFWSRRIHRIGVSKDGRNTNISGGWVGLRRARPSFCEGLDFCPLADPIQTAIAFIVLSGGPSRDPLRERIHCGSA